MSSCANDAVQNLPFICLLLVLCYSFETRGNYIVAHKRLAPKSNIVILGKVTGRLRVVFSITLSHCEDAWFIYHREFRLSITAFFLLSYR
jgi:hypothetical protein